MGLVLAMIGLVVLIVALVAALPAQGITDGGVDEPFVAPAMNQASYWEARFGSGWDCTKFENHNGNVPSSYEAAVVHDGQFVRVYNPLTVGTVLGPINPNNGNHFSAPHSWVMKCDYTQTTTTMPEETTTIPEETTTIPEETTTIPQDTTTIPEDTTTIPNETTTIPEETTTVPTTVPTTSPEDLLTFWNGGTTCDTLTANFDERGITQVDVWMRDPQFGDFGPADGLLPFSEPGSKHAAVGSPTTFILIPVVTVGYTAVPEQIELVVVPCPRDTTPTSVSPSSSTPNEPTDEVLPFTGIDMGTKISLGASAVLLGALLLWATRDRDEEEVHVAQR